MATEPLHSVLLLHPFLDALTAKGCPPDTFAQRLGVDRAELDDPSMLIPANTVYGFLRWSTEWSGEKTLCAQVGVRMAQGEWAPFVPLLAGGLTIWQFLLQFSASAQDQGGAATYRIEVEGKVALWKLTRPNSASVDAAYADATAVGFFVEVLKRALGEAFDSGDLLAVTSDRTLIAEAVIPSTSVLGGAKGMVLRFPSSWLEATLKPVDPNPDLPAVGLPDVGTVDLVDRATRVVHRHISDAGFDVQGVAQSLGMPVWKLQSELRSAGTSVAEIRNEMRRELAIDSIRSTDTEIAQIAGSLGYTSSSNFSRAFRKWTGLSPSQFRRG